MYRRYMVRDRDHDYTFIETSFWKKVELLAAHHPSVLLIIECPTKTIGISL